MLKFCVTGQRMELLFREQVADRQINFVDICFIFSPDWDGLDKTAQFEQGDKTYNVHLGDDTVCHCLLPAELQTGCVGVSAFGYAADGSVRATTTTVGIGIKRSGFSGDGDTPIPPTPDLYAQLIAEIDKKIADVHDGKDGADGKSAYQIAVDSGFDGTEQAWLASLKGEKGDKGDTGAAGAAGEKGEKGDPGETGAKGEKGDKGEPGATGAAGKDGADGKSAYQVAVASGFDGTEQEWLASLKGDKGDTGEPGAAGEKGEPGEKGDTGAAGKDGRDGTDGAAGRDGANGASAYEIAVQHGYGGSETAWLESLHGADGAKGDTGASGKDGADGFSPVAKVEKSGSVVTITITDANGTTIATLTEGAAVDLTPYAKTVYVDEKVQELSDSLTYTLQEHTLSITHLEESAHTHDNLETLNKISGTEWTQLVSTRHYHNNIETLNSISPADYENLSSKFPARITALEDSLGDIAAALADIVEVTE